MQWISPVAHNDPDSKWDNETRVYDGNPETYALDEGLEPQGYLELLLNEDVLCDKVKLTVFGLIGGEFRNADVVIDVWFNEAWNNIFTGTLTKDVEYELDINHYQYVVSKARIKGDMDPIHLCVNEFEFRMVNKYFVG